MYLYRMEGYVKHLKSTHPLLPIVGTAYGMIGKSATEAYKELLQFAKNNDTPVKTYIGSKLGITVDKPEDVKIILSSPRCLDKPFLFDFFPYRAGIFTATCKQNLIAFQSIDVFKKIKNFVIRQELMCKQVKDVE